MYDLGVRSFKISKIWFVQHKINVLFSEVFNMEINTMIQNFQTNRAGLTCVKDNL